MLSYHDMEACKEELRNNSFQWMQVGHSFCDVESEPDGLGSINNYA